MKNILLLLAGALLLSGCAGIFDANYFATVDTPPALTASAVANKTSDQLAVLAQDPSFFDQLKASPTALAQVQATLLDAMSNPDPDVAADAARTYITITTYSTESIAVVNNFVDALLPHVTAGDIASVATDTSAMQSMANDFFAGLSEDQVKATLISMVGISGALGTLANDTTTDTFFSADQNQGDVAQTAVVAAALTALMASTTGADLSTDQGKADAAALVWGLLQAPDPSTYMSTNFDSTTLNNQFTDIAAAATGGTSTTYAYLGDVMSVLPIPGV